VIRPGARTRLGAALLLAAAAAVIFPTGCNEPPEGVGRPAAAASSSVPVGRLVDAWVDMWNTYDLDRVEELFLDDARVTYFSSEKEGLIRGIDALVAHHEGFGFVRGGKDQPNRLWLEDLHQESFGEAAVVGATWLFRRGPDPETPPQRGPVTFVCVREGGAWRFAHMHFATYPEAR